MKAFIPSNSPVWLLIIIFFTLLSCNKDDNPAGIIKHTPLTLTTIGGRIILDSKVPAAFVKVSCNGITTTTDARGFYLLKNITVPAERCVILLENGFFKTIQPQKGSITYCNIVLPAVINEHSFNSISGGTIVDPSGVTLAFQPSSILTSTGGNYSGDVRVSIFYLDPAKPANKGMNPVHDNQLIIDNTSKIAFSLGATLIELYSPAGEKLVLNSLKPASLSIPIASTRLNSIPQSVLLVSGDVESGRWKQEGSATKSGNNFIASVSHFSWWNTVVPFGTATISGVVKDFAGHPVPNATLSEFTMMNDVRTDQFGAYTFYVYDGMDYAVSCDAGSNMGETAGPFITPVLSLNQNYVLPDIIFQNVTLVSGNTSDCSSFPLVTFVNIADSNGYFNYAIAGSSFTLFSGLTKNITLTASQFNQYHQTDTTVGPSGSLASVGTIQVCTTAPANGNMTITFTSLLTGTHTGTIAMNEAFADIDSANGWTYISMSSYDSLALFGTSPYLIDILLPVESSYINSIMPWSISGSLFWSDPFYMYGETYYNGFSYFQSTGYYDPSNPGNTHITFLGPVGSLITGSFEGPIDIYDSGVTILSGTISGSFSVTRNI